MLVAPTLGAADRNRQPRTATRGRVLHLGFQHGVGEFLGVQRCHFLPIVGIKLYGEPNAFEIYPDTVVGIVPKRYLYGDDAPGKWRFFRELLLVLRRIGP